MPLRRPFKRSRTEEATDSAAATDGAPSTSGQETTIPEGRHLICLHSLNGGDAAHLHSITSCIAGIVKCSQACCCPDTFGRPPAFTNSSGPPASNGRAEVYGGSSAAPAFEGTAGYSVIDEDCEMEDIKPHVAPFVLHEPEGVVTSCQQHTQQVQLPTGV